MKSLITGVGVKLNPPEKKNDASHIFITKKSTRQASYFDIRIQNKQH